VAWWRKNQDRLTAQCVAEEKEIADTEWWLTLIAVHEHYKFAGEAMRGLQGKTLLMERQLERLEQLLNEVTNLHTFRKRRSRRIPSRTLAASVTPRLRTLAVGLRQLRLAAADK
jgi:hypothetical protein